MLLSEAIREGAKLRPQATERYVRGGATCALGAACEVAFPDLFEQLESNGGNFGSEAVVLRFMAEMSEVLCPVCAGEEDPYISPQDIGELIVELNDHHKWTRESIADWLAGQGL